MKEAIERQAKAANSYELQDMLAKLIDMKLYSEADRQLQRELFAIVWAEFASR